MRIRYLTNSIAAGLAGTLVGVGLTVVPTVAPPADGPVQAAVAPQRLSGDGTVHPGWTRPVVGTADLVGVQWQGDPEARFAIETQNGRGAWHTVTEVGMEQDHRPDPGTAEAAHASTTPSTEPVWVGHGATVRVRLVRASVRDVVVDRIRSPRVQAPASTAGAMNVGMPGIISRAEWRADENLRIANCPEAPDTSSNVKIAVVHHTGGNNNYGPGDSASIVRGLYGYATQTLKYCDAHYNFFIDRYGQIFEGRYLSTWEPVRAAHTTGMNTASVGVAIIGNFQTSAVPAAALDALQRLLAWKLNWHGVDPTRPVDYTTISGTDRWPAGSTHTLSYIVGHRDPGSTDCPGDNLYALLPAIRASVAARILGGGADQVGGHTATSGRAKVAVMSRFGVVYPAGGAPELRSGAVWPGWAIARDVELLPSGAGGYTLDGFGATHAFGAAPPLPPSVYFPGFDIARDLVLRTGGGGYTLDGWGGIHEFGGAPVLRGGPYFAGNDVARKLVHFTSGWYVLDAFGALHPVAGAPKLQTPYWPGWPIARDVRANPGGSGGYILDGYGGVSPVGGAPRLTGTPYFGRDQARGFVVLAGGKGYTLREDGLVAAFSGTPAVSQSRATWSGAAAITTPWVVNGISAVP